MADLPSEVDFGRARRALEYGWVSQDQIEAALVARDSAPDRGIVDRLPLSPGQRRALASADRLPPEVAAALRDPSTAVGDDYVKVRFLAGGGQGLVYRGWDLELSRDVALKLLQLPQDAQARAYLRREALLAASLDHPNIAKIYRVGEHAGEPFIAMQFVEGRTLHQAREHLSLDQKLAAVRKTAEAVGFAHSRGVIHRDLKPANIMIDSSGNVTVMDFGLARRLDLPGQTLTNPNAAVGTPNYMAPEQVEGRSATSNDVYGLGAVLYELLTGRPPFVGENPAHVIAQVLTKEPVLPRRLNPDVSRDLEAVVVHALQKKPSRRYAGVPQFLEDLDRLADRRPLRYARRLTPLYVLWTRIRRQPLLWAFAATAALSLLGGAAFGTIQLLRRARDREFAAAEERATRRLTTLWFSVVEGKRDFRSDRVPVALARLKLAHAVEALGPFVAERPHDPRGWYVRARGLLYLHRVEEAERDARRALEAAPDFGPGWTLLGTILLEKYEERLIGLEDTHDRRRMEHHGILQEGIAALERGGDAGRWGLPASREDEVASVVAAAYLARYRGGKASPILLKAVEEYFAEEYFLHLALLAADTEVRATSLTSAIDAAPGYAVAWGERGLCRFKQGRWKEAIEDYDRAIELRPEAGWVWINRGNARLQAGDAKGALEDYDRSLELRPGEPGAFLGRAQALESLGRPDDAIAEYGRALRAEPGLRPAIRARAQALLKRERWEEAKEDFSALLDVEKAVPEHWFGRAHARYRLRDLDGAISDCTTGLELDPKHGDGLILRGFVRRKKGDLSGAVEDLTRAIAAGKDSAALRFERGHMLFALERYEPAVEDFSAAIRGRADWLEAIVYRARARYQLDRGKEALGDYDRALEIAPADFEIRAERGNLRLNLGDSAGAAADLEKALEQAPQDWTLRPEVERLLREARKSV